MNERYKIINNPDLTQEEKKTLLKMLDSALEKDKEDDDSKIYEGLEKYNEKQKEIVIKARKRAEENRKRIARINYEAEIKEKTEILSYLKNKMGENQFSKKYLDTLSGNEIRKIYEDCERTMPEYIKKAKNDRVFHKLHKGVYIVSSDEMKKINNEKKGNTSKEEITEEAKDEKKSDDNTISLNSIANRLNIDKEDLVKDLETKKKEKREPKRFKRLEDVKDKYPDASKKNEVDSSVPALIERDRNDDELNGQLIVKEENGSKFTRAKNFIKKYKKRLIVAAVIGSLAIAAYYLFKQGSLEQSHDIVSSMRGFGQGFAQNASDAVGNLPDDHTSVLDNIMDKTDVGNIDTTYLSNDDVISGNHGLSPNEWHQNKILGVVTGDNERLPAKSVQDILNYIDQGYDLTSVEVGGPDETGKNVIDGHVDTIQGMNLKEIIKERISSAGGRSK